VFSDVRNSVSRHILYFCQKRDAFCKARRRSIFGILGERLVQLAALVDTLEP
jgi:hypothetical protein